MKRSVKRRLEEHGTYPKVSRYARKLARREAGLGLEDQGTEPQILEGVVVSLHFLGGYVILEVEQAAAIYLTLKRLRKYHEVHVVPVELGDLISCEIVFNDKHQKYTATRVISHKSC